MKRIIAVILAVVLVVSLAACGGNETADTGSKAEKYCFNCGKDIAKDVAFCEYCGTAQNSTNSDKEESSDEPDVFAESDIVEITKNDFSYTLHRKSNSQVDVKITKYHGKSSDVKIPEEIKGYAVTSIGSQVFMDCDFIKSITIHNSVTDIGYRAFFKCSSLTSITIPDSVTFIDGNAFGGCFSLTSITIPDSVTEMWGETFMGCVSLISVTLSDNITNLKSYTFANCTSLTTITIPNSVTSIDYYAFGKCTSLTSITIPDSIHHIDDNAFEYSGLKTVYFQSEETKNYFADMFDSSVELKVK